MKKVHAMSSSIARKKKKQGHHRELLFNKYFGNPSREINFSGSSADCIVENRDLIALLNNFFSLNDYSLSLKGGRTTQIHLGWIEELSSKEIWMKTLTKKTINGKLRTCGQHGVNFKNQVQVLKSIKFWEKYLAKGSLLVYTDDCDNWWFFKMEEVIEFICRNFNWRLLDTGRIKGDYDDGINIKQIFTYEFRDESHKKTFVLGAHGGSKGLEFRNLLLKKVRSISAKKHSNGTFTFDQNDEIK